MATETLRFGFSSSAPRHVVEYRRRKDLEDDWNDEKRYDVHIDGADEPAGHIEQVLVSTSRSPITSRIRWGIGYHLEWGWRLYEHTPEGKRWVANGRHDRTRNYPGLYGGTRREAVADMLGLDSYVQKEKP